MQGISLVGASSLSAPLDHVNAVFRSNLTPSIGVFRRSGRVFRALSHVPGRGRFFVSMLCGVAILGVNRRKTPMTATVPAQTRIGHIHLKVAVLDRALQFYSGVLGFEVEQCYDTKRCFWAWVTIISISR